MTRQGFTIVELLVTIGIIALLLGLLMPALSGVGAAGRSTQCRSNLRQMALAAQQYAMVFDAWPVAVRYENDGVFTTIAWDWESTAAGDISPGPLWTFAGNPDRVQQCPEYHGSSSTMIPDPYTGYNYNTTYIGGEAVFPQTGWDAVRPGVAPHACQRASSCAMFGDGGRAGGTNKFMRAPLNRESLPLSLIYSGGQAFRHGGATNVAYVDGHVGPANTRQRGDMASDPLLNQFMDFPDNAFLSDDDRAYDPR